MDKTNQEVHLQDELSRLMGQVESVSTDFALQKQEQLHDYGLRMVNQVLAHKMIQAQENALSQVVEDTQELLDSMNAHLNRSVSTRLMQVEMAHPLPQKSVAELCVPTESLDGFHNRLCEGTTAITTSQSLNELFGDER